MDKGQAGLLARLTAGNRARGSQCQAPARPACVPLSACLARTHRRWASSWARGARRSSAWALQRARWGAALLGACLDPSGSSVLRAAACEAARGGRPFAAYIVVVEASLLSSTLHNSLLSLSVVLPGDLCTALLCRTLRSFSNAPCSWSWGWS